MLRREDYKWIRKWMALSLCIGFSLSGCGKQAETVSDYGNTSDSAQNGTEISSQKQDNQEARNDKYLSEQLGGKELLWNDTFSCGTIPVEVDLAVTLEDEDKITSETQAIVLKDTDKLSSYQVRCITADRVYEDEIVKGLFGETAKEYHAEWKLGEFWDDEPFVRLQQFYSTHPEVLNASVTEHNFAYPAWMESEYYYCHTWQGYYNNTLYYLIIAYDEMNGTKTICFEPANPGDAIGVSTCTKVSGICEDEDTIQLYGPVTITETNEGGASIVTSESEGERELSLKGMRNRKNRSLKSKEAMISDAELFLTQKMYVKTAAGSLAFNYNRNNTSKRNELFFYPGDTWDTFTPDEAVVDGYSMSITDSFGGINGKIRKSIGENDWLEGTIKGALSDNSGNIWVTDQGVIRAILGVSLEYGEIITENAVILSFEKIKETFQYEMEKNFDTSKVTGQKMSVKSVGLCYRALHSKDVSEADTMIPAWCFEVRSNNYTIAFVTLNAVNGSLIDIQYE